MTSHDNTKPHMAVFTVPFLGESLDFQEIVPRINGTTKRLFFFIHGFDILNVMEPPNFIMDEAGKLIPLTYKILAGSAPADWSGLPPSYDRAVAIQKRRRELKRIK